MTAGNEDREGDRLLDPSPALVDLYKLNLERRRTTLAMASAGAFLLFTQVDPPNFYAENTWFWIYIASLSLFGLSMIISFSQQGAAIGVLEDLYFRLAGYGEGKVNTTRDYREVQNVRHLAYISFAFTLLGYLLMISLILRVAFDQAPAGVDE